MKTVWFLLWITLCLLPLSLLAQQNLTEEQKQKANNLISQAENNYASQEYEKALQEYLDVYHLVEDPELFYNIAQCYRLTSQLPEAVQYYQLYLKEAKESTYRQSALEWLDKLLPLLPQEETTRQTSTPNKPEIKPFLLPGYFLAGGVLFGAATLTIKQLAKQGDQPLPLKRVGLGVSIVADLSFLTSGLTLGRAMKKRTKTLEEANE